MTLANVTSGLVKDAPMRLLVNGPPGIGKSTFAANAPSPIFVDVENGTEELDTKRWNPKTWGEVLGCIETLTNEPHDYRTVVFDTADAIEPLCWARVCEEAGKTSIEGLGYGKGYTEALRYWRDLLARLEDLQARRRMHVIFVAHVVLKTFKNPDHNYGDYDRYYLKMHEKAAGVLKEWNKAVLFASQERVTVEQDGRHRGMDTGRTILFTRPSALYDAKNRLWLPAELQLSWVGFMRAVRAGAELRSQFTEAMSLVDETTRENAQEFVEQSNYDPQALTQAIEVLRAKAINGTTKEVES
jgi:hypothetical protein